MNTLQILSNLKQELYLTTTQATQKKQTPKTTQHSKFRSLK
jgi:hypothetical protein